MCGIFGVTVAQETDYKTVEIQKVLNEVALLSESRGKDSSGLCIRLENVNKLNVVKGDVPINKLLKTEEVSVILKNGLDEYKAGSSFAAFGHARLVTNGSQLEEVNNQPVLKDDIALVHNGIITNSGQLWDENGDIERKYSIDTEIINSRLRFSVENSENISEAFISALKVLKGTYSIACTFQDFNLILLATNNGSLYYVTDEDSYLIFASEGYHLKELIKTSAFKSLFGEVEIKQLKADDAILINLAPYEITNFNVSVSNSLFNLSKKEIPLKLDKKNVSNNSNKQEVVIDPSIYINRNEEQHLFNLLEYNLNGIRKLKRCTKCVLPETFPFLNFDENGVCNYCRNYTKKNELRLIDELKALIEPYRSKNDSSDCIVPFSGGRDSTYTLHIVKEVLGLNPIAFTYDWGMVTDLARRNIARVCGELGVENIIVSADIHWKRENIRKNIGAWLRKPELGMIPLFMAGDKYFFYYTNKLKKQTGIDLNIWGINYLENTEFKTGFAGLPPEFEKDKIYSLSFLNQLKLFGFVAKNVIKSPSYLNQSVLDSIGSFATRYIEPKKDYYHLFDYYKWDEHEINSLLIEKYNWETAIDTSTTWRIGDGTASFYNYIYCTVAGFSEVDTFRSNQIREADLDRETALKLIEDENKPRYETLRWYLDIVNLDYELVIKRINEIPKLY